MPLQYLQMLTTATMISLTPNGPSSLSHPQTHPLVGKWDVQLPSTKVMQKGGSVDVEPKGELAFAIEGDSIVGTLKTLAPEGATAPTPMRLSAKVVEGRVTFVVRKEAQLVSASDVMTKTAVIRYEFEANGNSLKGSVERSIEGIGVAMGGAQPITGKKVSG